MRQVTVRIPTPLRPFSGHQSEVDVDATNVGEALRSLVLQHVDLAPYLFDTQGDLRRFVNVYLENRNVHELDGLSSETAPGDTIHIVPAVAGGRA